MGFVGTAKAKEALIRPGLPDITLRGTKGGSTVAANIVNALLNIYLSGKRDG